jgi:hypothetical protein
LAACRPPAGPLDALLDRTATLREVTARAAEYRLQVVVGTVAEQDGRKVLTQRGFRLGEEYFYPASSVKLFAAVAALERLAELRAESGLPLALDTPLVYHPLFEGEVLEDADPSHVAGGTITLGHEIRKLFLVSDNEAFNKLYEFVGQDRLAASLERSGLGDARIVHRLAEPRSAEENRRFPRIDFRLPDSVFTLPERTSEPLAALPTMPGLQVGTAHLTDAGRVDEPLDMAAKNRIALADLQRGLCKVVQPDVDCGGGGAFELSDADRSFLLAVMSQLPRQSKDPVYDHPDDFVKFFLPGLARVVPAERLRIYNKIGQAYGFTTENAWIVDLRTGRSFFFAATLYTNADGVLNDDVYEYREVAAPFLADLGEAVARELWGAP